jgi:hypothetical protein
MYSIYLDENRTMKPAEIILTRDGGVREIDERDESFF